MGRAVKHRPISAVPLRERATCEQCRQPLDTKAPGNAQFVHGYAVNRDAGGANMITLMERKSSWLCRVCLDLRRRGKSWTQPSLFGDES